MIFKITLIDIFRATLSLIDPFPPGSFDFLEHALRLLQEHVRFLVLVFLYEFVRDVRELKKQERDLVLVYLDLF